MTRRRASDAVRQPQPGPALRLPFDREWLQQELLARLIAGYSADPAAALIAAGDRLGVGPVPLFAPTWYRARHGLGAQDDAIQHYLCVGAGSGLDPHPLFSTSHYLAQAPDAAGNPLHHFLETGGPAGLDCHPLFCSRWYWRQNPDVHASGTIPIFHYLKWGAAEGREPNPLFDSAFYVRQTSDPNATANPLLHFVLKGEAGGLSPNPGFRSGALAETFETARAAGALAAYLSVVGPAQADRAATLGRRQEEPGIVPPRLAVEASPSGAATEAGIALLRSFGVAPGHPASGYLLHKLEALQGDKAALTDFAGAAGSHDMAGLLEGAGLVPASRPLPPAPDPDSLLLTRYSARQFAIAQRFAIDPARAGTAAGGALISVLLPVYRSPLHLLERAILSVMGQTYPDWELCIVDDGSGQPGLTAMLARFAAADRRIKLAANGRNGGIAAASNRALALVTGDHVGLLDHDDMLTSDALERVARALQAQPETDLIYTDECTIDADDVPCTLFTKPDWSPILLTAFMYTSHFSVYRTALVRAVGGFRSAFDFSQDYDLALRVAERDPAVIHLREVLYGWRMVAGSAAMGGKPQARASNIAALQAALDRRGCGGRAIALPMTNRIGLTMTPPPPMVSIVIPSDTPELIEQAAMSVLAHTAYPNYEVVVVARTDVIAACTQTIRPGRVRFVAYDQPFNFSAKCNEGAAAARGEHLIFFNDDVRVLTPDWIEAILEALTLPGVGAAGPKLLYEDHTIQHAGMITGTRRLVSTAFHAFPHRTPAHLNMAQSLREVSLLSGACLAMPDAVFRALGGFDTVNTPVMHSDVDLCLRLRETGLSCVYTPHAELTHIGHLSLGAAEQEAAFRPDKADLYLLRRFAPLLEEDPYFPPGMHELLATGDQVPFRLHAAHPPPQASAGRDALLVSHDLSGSGAPKVVFDMARVLIGAGWQVVVMSPEDGPFRERLRALGASVLIEPGALGPDPSVVAFARNFDVVIGNTVLCWCLPPALARFTNVYLYAHETGLTSHLAHAHPTFIASLSGATGVWAGSERAAAVLRRLGAAPLVLEYGVEAPEPSLAAVRGRDIVIAVLAAVEPRKGQDLAVKAFPLLPARIKERCRLRLHGRPHDPVFAEAIVALAAPEPRIEIGPELDLEAYRRELAAADIVLCPSRDDTLPLISLNALAEGKVLVCSRDVGTSAYIEDGVSGFVLPDNHPAEIAAVLARVVAERARWREIGEAARRVFRDHFSEERFERRLLAILESPQGLVRAAE